MLCEQPKNDTQMLSIALVPRILFDRSIGASINTLLTNALHDNSAAIIESMDGKTHISVVFSRYLSAITDALYSDFQTETAKELNLSITIPHNLLQYRTCLGQCLQDCLKNGLTNAFFIVHEYIATKESFMFTMYRKHA